MRVMPIRYCADVADPDGVWVQINMFDRELYT